MKYILKCPNCHCKDLLISKTDYDFICLKCNKKNVFINMYFEDERNDNEIVTIKRNLTKEQKILLIETFYKMYYNTDQDTEDFATEFYDIVGLISIGEVPVKLKFLADFQETIFELIKEYNTEE